MAAISWHVHTSFHTWHAPWHVMLLAGVGAILLLGVGAGILVWFLTRNS